MTDPRVKLSGKDRAIAHQVRLPDPTPVPPGTRVEDAIKAMLS